jgi:serine/threonine protein kinase
MGGGTSQSVLLPEGTRIVEGARLVCTLRRLVGQGGFSDVYEAALGDGSKIAIKILRPRQSEFHLDVERFAREASAASKLDHPNIIHTLSHARELSVVLPGGERWTGPLPWMALEFLEGCSLLDEVDQRGAVAPERLLPLFLGALEGLQVVHDAGMIHRDLKPANLFLERTRGDKERLKIVDFGIAAIDDPDAVGLTRTNHIVGTARYLSPEYIRTRRAMPSLDIYQMGMVLAEGLSGEKLVRATDAIQAMAVHLEGRLNVQPWLMDGALGPVLRKALAREPAQRYASAAEFAHDLRAVDPSKIKPRVETFRPGAPPPPPPAPLAQPKAAGSSPSAPALARRAPEASAPGSLDATERVPLEGLIPVDHKTLSLRQGSAPTARSPRAEPGPSRRGLWVGVGLVVVCLLGLAFVVGGEAMKGAQGVEGGAPLLSPQGAQPAQDDPLALAERALQEGEWEQALGHAERVPAQDARARAKAQTVKRHAERQIKARPTYERALAALNAGAWDAALEQLQLLPKDDLPSGYTARAKREGLEERAKKGLQIRALLQQAREQQKKGKLPAARATVQRALQLDPTHKEAQALAEALGPAAP